MEDLQMNFNQYYRMEEVDNVVSKLDYKYSKYRATYEARIDGMKEADKDYRSRMLDTYTYCNSIGKTYEEAIRMSCERNFYY